MAVDSVEAEAEDIKAAEVIEMVGDGDVTTVVAGDEAVVKVLGEDGVATRTLVGDGAVPNPHTVDRSSSLQRPTMRQ